MKKRFGLFYTKNDGKQYLYKSCYTFDEVVSTVETDDFQAIEKTSISIVDLLTGGKKEEKEEEENGKSGV